MSGILSDSVNRYTLTPKAVSDLDDIWRYSAENWSLDQADLYIDGLVRVFDLIVTMPTMARQREEFNPPVRIHIHAEHIIVYTVKSDMVVIIRVLGGGQNWKAILQNTE